MNDAISNYVDQFTALLPTIAREPAAIQRQRETAMGYLRDTGFPGPRDEDWRYTPLRPLVAKPFTAVFPKEAAVPDLAPFIVEDLDSYRLVFVDGLYNSQLSSGEALPEGVKIVTLADALASDDDLDLPTVLAAETIPGDGFRALNTAFSRDGYLVSIDDDTVLPTVLEFMFLSAGDGNVAQARNVLRMGKHSKARVLERHVSLDGVRSMVNLSTRLVLEPGASLDYHIVETAGDRVSMINDLEADLDADSRLTTVTATLGGEVVRNNLKIRLNGAGAHCNMLGMYAATGRQHVDNHTGVTHAVPHCTSRELYKGVLDKRARGVFHGRIRVDQGAVKTDATQANNNLLLSPDAEIDTKPQLEIYADDVKCAHGATVGQMDETALFYLRSRGIDEAAARSLLTFAFVNDVLGDITIDAVRELLESELSGRLINHE